jgi:hypothetical protein
MRANRALILASLVVIVAGAGIAVREGLAARQLNSRLAAELDDQNSLRRQINNLEGRRRQLAADLIRAKGTARERGSLTRSPTAKTPATNQSAHTDSVADQLRRIRGIEAWIDLRDHLFFAKLGLSADQIEQAEKLMAEFSQGMNDIATAAANQDMQLSDSGIRQMRQAAMAQFTSQMTALLGSEDFAQFQQFSRAAPAGTIVADVAATAFRSGSPITATQGEQLTQIIASASPEYQSGGNVNPDTVDWSAVQAQAQTVLPAQQFAAVQSASEDIQNRRILRKMASTLRAQLP